jgi:hypothetical protein
LSSLLAAAAAAAVLAQTMLPGIFTNEEQVYFAREAGGPVPQWAGLLIEPEGSGFRLRSVDAYGQPGPEDQPMVVAESGERFAITTGRCTRLYELREGALEAVESRGTCRAPYAFHRFTPGAVILRMADGGEMELRRARPFTCWAAIPKRAPKPDGSTSWWGARNIVLHDQGGRVKLETDEPEPQRFEIRMRNVVWPDGPNQPSLVLYVFEPNGERAIAYSWADPGAVRVGINIRTLQASCALDQKDTTIAGAR